LAAREEERDTIVGELRKMGKRFKEAGVLLGKLGVAGEG
jgi:hypothetical protein